MSYRECVKEMAAYIRSELNQVEEIHSIDFELSIDGRNHDGELKIEFRLGSQYNAGGVVKGGDLEKVVLEYKRRFGWDQRNQPLELSFVPEPKIEIETDITGVAI